MQKKQKSNTNNIKRDFPIFSTYPNLIYLDNAATTQKPLQVITAVENVYKRNNANVHRGIYNLAEKTTQLYEDARNTVAEFIGAFRKEEIIFTKNINESIQLIVSGWGEKYLRKGDIVILSEMEHHANVIPWIRLKEKIGIEVIYVPLDEKGRLLYDWIPTADIDVKKIKVVSLTYVSNVLGTINPLKEIRTYFLSLGIVPIFIIDGAQAVGHIPVNVRDLHCDFLAFSSHKMFGPSGVGVLWGKTSLLEEMDPLIGGSHSIGVVKKDMFTWAEIPDKFEPGTPNIEGAIGLAAAISYINTLGLEKIQDHEMEILNVILNKFSELPFVAYYGPKNPNERLGIFSFSISGVHPHDIAQMLDSRNICIRAGNHCAQILMQTLGLNATARMSISIYTTQEDINIFFDGLEKTYETLVKGK